MRPDIRAIVRLTVIGALSAAAFGCSDGGSDARDSPASTPGTPAAATRPGVIPSLSGGTWTETITAESGAVMGSVAVTGHDDAWAVGDPGENESGPVLRWDGRTWRSVALPPGLRYPRVVSGTSPGNVWIFDDDANAWQWDGRRWSARGRPPWKLPVLLEDAVVTGPGEVWVAGGQDEDVAGDPRRRPLLARWSPSGWSIVSSPGTRRFGVSASGGLWALTGDGDTGPALERWDGRRWTVLSAPAWPAGAKVDLSDLAAVSDREVWVAGSILPPGGSQAALLMRWDGDRWNPAPALPAGAIAFTAVASDGHGGVWLGASNYSYDNHRILLHFDGRSWTYEKAPRVHNDPVVFGLATSPGQDQVFAVGGNPSYDEDSQAWIWTRS
ncbi:hypothetical protein FLW53_18815 [Microbispora sp. SCL1-1]|uniref:Galactose oxidase n=1 Tax=Microbispora hainanensis TaxID=568844 RepID=A0ABZ1SRZ1_9ACTN|nr:MULTISPECIES: hypothetical protein [Microbispora]NJP26216.1 hypothetical protein [Microbispora sp. CL1-1]TQS12640.1 hypothetical protein FLW53_18815 [Microbispora sp. SCL1-1]